MRQALGLTGAGVGVAVIGSGVTSWHDDLSASASGFEVGNQRVAHFVDLVNDQSNPYDDYGHGTDVSGIIAGNGYHSAGARSGVAPGAHIVSVKVLDNQGVGYVSDVIAALDYIVSIKDSFNIRVINVLVGAGIYESYWTDPLTLAARRAVDAGIVVVAAAGNLGKNDEGESQYGGISAPGNAPWVITVGASNHRRTASRDDDVMASWSSRGPTYIDFGAKPDLIAPGTGTVSLSDPASALYTMAADHLLPGTIETPYLPYLTLSGTSMAAPVVSGTVALMMEADPTLTPNLVKAILQYTSRTLPEVDYLTQGAGLLDTAGAVELADFFDTALPGDEYPIGSTWGDVPLAVEI